VGVQDVKWDRGDTDPGDNYTFFYGNENHQLGTEFFMQMGIASAVIMEEFVSDRLSYMRLLV
jgi:hypothetical protein